MGAADGAGQNGAVLGENVNRSAVNFSETGHNAVGGKFFSAMPKSVHWVSASMNSSTKAAGVEKLMDALPGRQLAFGALFCRYFRIAVSGALLQRREFLFLGLLWCGPLIHPRSPFPGALKA